MNCRVSIGDQVGVRIDPQSTDVRGGSHCKLNHVISIDWPTFPATLDSRSQISHSEYYSPHLLSGSDYVGQTLATAREYL